MEIKVLGTRGEIEPSVPYHSRHSGVLINGQLLVDVGEKEFLQYDPRWIIISHLHADHAYFARRESDPIKKAKIFAPESFPEQNITVAQPEEELQLGKYRITPLPTLHSKKVKTVAYLIETKRKQILYTGDLLWLEKQYHHYWEQLDLVITEASFIRQGGRVQRDEEGNLWGHTGVPNLIRLFGDYTDRILFIHFGSWFYKLGAPKARAKLSALADEDGLRVEVGYDGQLITV